MPKVISRKTSHVEASGFNIYDGPEPLPKRAYRAVVKKAAMGKSSGGNLMIELVVEFKAKPGTDAVKYDGWAGFPRAVLTDKEGNIRREQSLYLAICGKADADIKTAGDPTKFAAGDGQRTPITSIGGKNPVGVTVMAFTQAGEDRDGNSRIEVDQVFPVRKEEGQEADADDEEEELPENPGIPQYTEDDLKGKSLQALRMILIKDFEVDDAEAKAIRAKGALIERILEEQEATDEDEDLEDEDEDEELEEEELEEEDDEDDEEELDEEEEEDDLEEQLTARAADLNRNQLKAELKKFDKDMKFKTTQSDDDLRTMLVEMWIEEPPF